MRDKPTRAWYLVPLLFGILGGIIGYFAVKNEDQRLANNLLIVGIVVTFLIFLLGFLYVLFLITLIPY